MGVESIYDLLSDKKRAKIPFVKTFSSNVNKMKQF